MDISNTNWIAMSDTAISEAIGTFVRHQRLEQNKTQKQLAKEAGINRSTLVSLEKGLPSGTMTLIQVLRALKQLHLMEHFTIISRPSPLQVAKMEKAKRQRASKQQEQNKTQSDW